MVVSQLDLILPVVQAVALRQPEDVLKRHEYRVEKEEERSRERLHYLIRTRSSDVDAAASSFKLVAGDLRLSARTIRIVANSLRYRLAEMRRIGDFIRYLAFKSAESKAKIDIMCSAVSLGSAPQRLFELSENNDYLKLAEAAVEASELSQDGPLAELVGPRTFCGEIAAKRKSVEEKLIRDLEAVLWRWPLGRALSVRRRRLDNLGKFQPVFKYNDADRGEFSRKAFDYITAVYHLLQGDASAWDQFGQESNNKPAAPKRTKRSGRRGFDFTHYDDPRATIATLVSCFDKLSSLPRVVDAIGSKIQENLLSLVKELSRELTDDHAPPIEVKLVGIRGQVGQVTLRIHPLVDFWNCLCDACWDFMALEQCFVSEAAAVLGKFDTYFDLYDSKEIWMKIQGVLQLVVSDYLDLKSLAARPMSLIGVAKSSTHCSVLNSMFEPNGKKAAEVALKMPCLFSFNNTVHGRLQNDLDSGLFGPVDQEVLSAFADYGLVCRPEPHNIRFMLHPIMTLLLEVNGKYGFHTSGTHGISLIAFFQSYLEDVYYPYLYKSI